MRSCHGRKCALRRQWPRGWAGRDKHEGGKGECKLDRRGKERMAALTTRFQGPAGSPYSLDAECDKARIGWSAGAACCVRNMSTMQSRETRPNITVDGHDGCRRLYVTKNRGGDDGVLWLRDAPRRRAEQSPVVRRFCLLEMKWLRRGRHDEMMAGFRREALAKTCNSEGQPTSWWNVRGRDTRYLVVSRRGIRK